MKPFITTERDIIRSVPKRWEQQYARSSIKFERITKRLQELDVETCTVEDISRIIGNDSWVRMRCDSCSDSVLWRITLGEEEDYESRTTSLFRNCFDEAVQLVKDSDATTNT